jgi:uncharacterized protein involved in exopolysaccharide biosynthesis
MSSATDSPETTGGEEGGLEIWRWSRLVWRARRLVAITTAAGAVLLLGHGLLQPPTYRATMRLLVARPVSMRLDASESTLADYLTLVRSWSATTQVEALKSEGLAGRALSSLPADQRAFFPARVSRLQNRVSVDVRRDSDLVTVRTVSGSGEASVALANSLADCYIEQMQAAATEVAAMARGIVEPELAQTRDLLVSAEQELAKQRETSGVYDPKRERELAVERLTSLRQQHSDDLATLAATQAGLATARELVSDLPESVLFQHLEKDETQPEPLASELARLEGQLAKLAQEYLPESPEVQRATREVEMVRELLERPPVTETVQRTEASNPVRQDVEKVASGLRVQEAQLTRQTAEVGGQIKAEAARLDRISAEEVAQASLAARSEALQAQHTALAAQIETLRLRAAARLPSATVLERASLETTVEHKPRRQLLGIAGAFLGFLVGSLVAVAAGTRPGRSAWEATDRATE